MNSVPDLNTTMRTTMRTGVAPTAVTGPADLVTLVCGRLDELRDVHHQDLGRAASLSLQVVDLGRRCGDRGLLADALAAAANVYASRDEVYRCYPFALEAQHLFEAQGRMAEAGRMLNLRGICFDVLGDAERALELYAEALAMLKAAGDESYIPRVLNNIGVVDLRQGYHTSAIACLTEAVQRGEALPHAPAHRVHLCTLAEARAEYGIALQERAGVAEARWQIDDALTLLAKIESASFETEAIGVRAACLNVASRLHLLLGNLERGREYTIRLWSVAKQCGSPNYVAVAYARFAELRGMQQRIPKACRWRQRAQCEFEQLQMKNELRDMLERLSTVVGRSGDTKYALQFFKHALALRKETHTAGAAVRSQLLAFDREAEQQRRHMQEALIHTGKMALVGSLVTELNADLKGPLADAGVCVTHMFEACGRRDSVQLERWLVHLLAIVDELRARVQRLDVFCRRDAGVFGVVTLRAAMKEALWIVGARHGAFAQQVRLTVADDHVWCNADRLVLLVVSVLDHLLRRQGGAQGSIEIGSRAGGDGLDLLVSFDGEVVDDALLARPLEQLMSDAAESGAPGLELMIAAEAALAMNTRLGSRVDAAGRGEYRVHLGNPKAASEAEANGATQRPAGVGV